MDFDDTPPPARLSRKFLALHRVHRYRMKAVRDMTDEEAVRACHWYCEENRLTAQWEAFRRQAEADDLSRNAPSQLH